MYPVPAAPAALPSSPSAPLMKSFALSVEIVTEAVAVVPVAEAGTATLESNGVIVLAQRCRKQIIEMSQSPVAVAVIVNALSTELATA